MKTDTDGYQYKVLTGYANRGKVKRYLDSGWEIVNAVPTAGGTINMSTFYLRRKTG